MTEYAITTQVPDVFTAADCAILTKAAAAAFPAFEEEWDRRPQVVTFYPDRAAVPKTAYEVSMVGTSPGDSGVEAYHEDPDGNPDGLCFAGYLLSQGVTKFGPNGVVEAFLHECFEIARNPRANLLIQAVVTGPDGKTYQAIWAEVCDPAQGLRRMFTIDGIEVATPSFVTQSWEDPHGAPPYSIPAGVPGPLVTAGPEAYRGLIGSDWVTTTQFGAEMHPAKQALVMSAGRIARAASARYRLDIARTKSVSIPVHDPGA